MLSRYLRNLKNLLKLSNKISETFDCVSTDIKLRMIQAIQCYDANIIPVKIFHLLSIVPRSVLLSHSAEQQRVFFPNRKDLIDLLFHHDVNDDRKELWTELVMKVSLIWEESISSRYIDLYGKRFSKEDHVSFVKIYLPFIVKGSIWRNTKISIHALNMLIGFVFIFQTL